MLRKILSFFIILFSLVNLYNKSKENSKNGFNKSSSEKALKDNNGVVNKNSSNAKSDTSKDISDKKNNNDTKNNTKSDNNSSSKKSSNNKSDSNKNDSNKDSSKGDSSSKTDSKESNNGSSNDISDSYNKMENYNVEVENTLSYKNSFLSLISIFLVMSGVGVLLYNKN